MEHQVEGYGAAEHLRQITSADGHLAHQPIGPTSPSRIPVTAALSEVLAGHHAQASGNYLHKDRHQTGETHHPQEPVLESCASLQVCSPGSGVQVSHANQNRRPHKCPPLLPKS